MYRSTREVPAATLDALLAHPMDAARNDALLFTPDGNWRLTRSELPDDELRRRFDCPHVPTTLDQMRTLCELDGGKYGSDDDEPTFPYLLAAIETGQLPIVLATHDVYELARRIALPSPVVAEPSWTGSNGEQRWGFATDVPTYGINGFTRPAAIAATWATLRRGLERWPEHRAALLEQYASDIAFFYGASARGSAALFVMW